MYAVTWGDKLAFLFHVCVVDCLTDVYAFDLIYQNDEMKVLIT